MYTLISALAKPLNGNGRWRSVEIGDVAVSTIFSTYLETYAVLSNPFLTAPVSLRLADIRSEHGGKNITFNELLVSLGTAALPTSETIPELNTRYAKYADAFHAGYKVTPIHPTAAPDAEMPEADRTWLRLTRPGTDFGLFHRSCLVSVNGFFHFMDSDANSAYVVDGMKSRTLSRQNQIGIYSFRELGQLTYVPITPEMVYKQKITEQYRDRCYIDLGQDISNKTVLLVLGGYLHVFDPTTFYRVGNQQVCVNLQSLPLFDRYYESKKYLDYSSLELESTSRNPSQISVDDFLSDEVLLRYLTLSQSFFVILDNVNVFAERETIHTTRMPGMFISFTEPRYPLVVGVGKVADYWYTYEDGQYSLTCYDSFRDLPVYQTTDAKAENSIADSRVTQHPVIHSRGAFLKIGSDI